MIGAIIGDIVGSRFEFSKAPAKGFELFAPECDYTDDTICTIAIADAILNGKEYKDALLEWCRRYPNPLGGYEILFHRWLTSENPQPYGSSGNGPAMRVGPVAWLFTEFQQVQEEARKTAMPTHNHEEGQKGAECIATIAYWLHNSRINRDEVERKVEKLWGYEVIPLKDVYRIGSQGHFDGTCMETVPMAIRCFIESQNFEEAIRMAVMAGGDTDTKACITGILAEAFYEIPDHLVGTALSYLPDEMLDIVTQFYNRIGQSI